MVLRSFNLTPFSIYTYGAIALSALSGVAVSISFFLAFGPLAAIITGVLYSLALVCTLVCKSAMTVVFYPRYDMLSDSRKDEVDRVRVRGVKRLLEDVTLTLEKENMMQKALTKTNKSPSSITTTTVETSSSYLEHLTSSSECSEEEEEEEQDVELGHHHHHALFSRSGDKDVTNDDCGDNGDDNDDVPVVLQLYDENEGTESEDDVEYTHVRVPCQSCKTTDPKSLEPQEQEVDTPPTREVSIECSICLCSYEEHNNLCYSSNPECPHVFHSDCLIQWFVEMGRRQSDAIIGHRDELVESQLLDYTLSCPCCRQPFVQSELLKSDDGGGCEKKEKMSSSAVKVRRNSKVVPVLDKVVEGHDIDEEQGNDCLVLAQ